MFAESLCPDERIDYHKLRLNMLTAFAGVMSRLRSWWRCLVRASRQNPPLDETNGSKTVDAVSTDDLDIGLQALRQRDYTAAIVVLQRVTRVAPQQFATAQEWLGSAFLKIGRPDLAVGPLSRVVQLGEQLNRDPLTRAEGHFSLGLAFARTAHDESALIEFHKALRLVSNWGAVLFEIARVHARHNRIKAAVAALQLAATQDDEFVSRAWCEREFYTLRESDEFRTTFGSCVDSMCSVKPDASK